MDNETLYHHGIKGMKWGVRRYQNADGTLTSAGKTRRNQTRWTTEQIQKKQKIVNASSKLVQKAQELERTTSPKPVKRRMDLTHMTDKELRDAINRETLEVQYNQLFGKIEQPKIDTGRKIVRGVLQTAGDALTIGSSVLGVMLAINELKKR